jgi:hypothetical protein
MSDPIPTAEDVVAHLNERFAARGVAFRIESLHVLPYVNPMWLANWALDAAAPDPEREVVEEELADARWRFPQILGNW